MHVATDMPPEMPGTNDCADAKKQSNVGQLVTNNKKKEQVHTTLCKLETDACLQLPTI